MLLQTRSLLRLLLLTLRPLLLLSRDHLGPQTNRGNKLFASKCLRVRTFRKTRPLLSSNVHLHLSSSTTRPPSAVSLEHLTKNHLLQFHRLITLPLLSAISTYQEQSSIFPHPPLLQCLASTFSNARTSLVPISQVGVLPSPELRDTTCRFKEMRRVRVRTDLVSRIAPVALVNPEIVLAAFQNRSTRRTLMSKNKIVSPSLRPLLLPVPLR